MCQNGVRILVRIGRRRAAGDGGGCIARQSRPDAPPSTPKVDMHVLGNWHYGGWRRGFVLTPVESGSVGRFIHRAVPKKASENWAAALSKFPKPFLFFLLPPTRSLQTYTRPSYASTWML